MLRAYAEKHQATLDIALELPTGTGKMLPGLLIAEWVRRKAAGPVLEATPTRYPPARCWRRRTARAYLRICWSAATAFGASPTRATSTAARRSLLRPTARSLTAPKPPVPRLIVFDDAHAGEQFVGEHYSVTIRRYEAEPAYLGVLDALRPFLSGLQIQRLQGCT